MIRGNRAALIMCLALLTLAGAGCGRKGASTAPPSASDVAEFDSAVRDGDTSIVSRLISAKPEMINAKDENGKTPVTIATEKGDQEMIALLRRHGGHE
jgi:ankyrin repeat protein